jgi:hypothetical protein
LTTYQRNIQPSSEDEFDDFFGHEIGGAEVEAGDGDEPEYDGGRLRDMTAVGPLHALELSPARAQESHDAVAGRQRRAGRSLADAGDSATSASRWGSKTDRRAVTILVALERGAGNLQRVFGGPVSLQRLVCVLVGLRGVWRGRDPAGSGHERGIELVDVARGVLERSR